MSDHHNLIEVVQLAFAGNPELGESVLQAADESPMYQPLFRSIAHYILSRAADGDNNNDTETRPTKRLRVQHDPPPKSSNDASNGATEIPPSRILLSMKDISFISPQRKKLMLECTELGIRAKAPGSENEVFGVRWGDIKHAVCVPVPEKAQRQHHFCIFPTGSDGVSLPSGHANVNDALVWTVPDASPPSQAVAGEDVPKENDPLSSTYRSLLIDVINRHSHKGVKVVEPDERLFTSAIAQHHRKGEKAVHVKAFRGNKDGFLYFLPTGIMWAFKKPLLFFSFPSITSVSYTSVLQRTFNLNIAVPVSSSPEDNSKSNSKDDDAETIEFEFSMIDQEDYNGINAYVKRHSLHDASMAEARRAKAAKKGQEMNGDMEGAEKEVEKVLKKEEEDEGERGGQQGQDGEEGEYAENGGDDDEEEEEGEDYDPGSEGESEGSGDSTSASDGGGEGDQIHDDDVEEDVDEEDDEEL
ncbi:MAG: hypothetical protein M1823_005072 [Watsoniomyces obsoletus]|nr:MAG: hypothetical protein M1823_005072 [Watsoniomyces obsoletus]